MHVDGTRTCKFHILTSVKIFIMAEKNNFSEGKEFENYEQFLEALHGFCNSTYQPFVVTTNNQRQVTLRCRHGYETPSKSFGERTHLLSYNYPACEAKISCYKPALSTRVRITSMNLQHNHEISKSACGTAHLSDHEEEVVRNLVEGNCKNADGRANNSEDSLNVTQKNIDGIEKHNLPKMPRRANSVNWNTGEEKIDQSPASAFTFVPTFPVDEYRLFLELVYSKMMNFSDSTKRKVQREINEILYKAEDGEYDK